MKEQRKEGREEGRKEEHSLWERAYLKKLSKILRSKRCFDFSGRKSIRHVLEWQPQKRLTIPSQGDPISLNNYDLYDSPLPPPTDR
jgi:hypothetical protein